MRTRQHRRNHQRQKIACFGHFGAGNFGNEATLQAILWNLRRLLPQVQFTCICTHPEIVASNSNITAIPSRDYVVRPWALRNPLARFVRKLFVGVPSELYRWLSSIGALRHADALIIPGTGLLTDVSTLLYWGPYDLFRWSVAAKLCRCKLFFVSVGAGPLYTRRGRFFVKVALSLADFRSYRDESSKRFLKGIGLLADNDPVYPDLAFSLPEGRMSLAPNTRGRKLVVGVGLMEDARNYSVERPANFTHRGYLLVFVEFVMWLLGRDIEVRLLIGSGEDRDVTKEFRHLIQQRSSSDDGKRIIDEPIESVQDLLAQLAATDFVVATRFHNVLLALLLNKPVISISFHHKCSSLMNQMGLSQYCQDINHLNADRLIAQFCQLQQNAGRVKRLIQEKVSASRDALDEQYSTIFDHVCPQLERPAPPSAEFQDHPNDGALAWQKPL